jgi:hypothetical protein
MRAGEAEDPEDVADGFAVGRGKVHAAVRPFVDAV